eukprot:CAMPEP_0182512490 /NCGR_PEP_ID=MMETSP1321-20130603/32222_1 /TAXON_ID=91990 /ORGANISM="Bolidomonas sp., Strain RCC1657" /LENGTH=180 /DNA_ID=CAMNT_0024719323 /DNA_START=176 /DNA_END=715 /DNA_ORIENTATION=+
MPFMGPFIMPFIPHKDPFIPPAACCRTTSCRTTFLSAGGWGKKAKDYSEAELSTDKSIEAKPVESYELQQQTDFMNRVRQDRSKLLRRKESDFLAIASSAGLLKDQATGEEELPPMSKFDEMFEGELEEDIDLRVYDNVDEKEVKKNSLEGFDPGDIGELDEDTSITRMDGMNDVAKWGD